MSRKLASNYRSSVVSGVSTGSAGTGIGDVTGDLLDITYQEEVRRRPYEGPKPIVCEPPHSFKRELGAIPFHIPHKKLLEKIEYKRVMPEPLTGFQQFQELTMQSRKRTLSEDTLVVPKSVKKAQRPGITFREYRSRRHTTKLEYVMDQKEWIEKFRQTTDGSFVYMTYAVPNSHELFYPYALSIVPYKQVDKSNFFTMSAKGVMQHVGSEIIFTTLDKWEKEYNMYCRLMEIRLFHYFRKWKGFYVWRINVKRKKIYNAKRNLEENMLSLNPILRQGLLDIQDMCFKMIDVTFTDVSDIENTWLFYFIEDQMDKFHQIMKKIEEYHEVAREVVGNACHAALLAKGFVVDERIIDESIKDKRKRIHKASYIEQAAKKKFCERLASFIILVDYITINMLHQLITNSTHDLLCALEKHTQFLPTQQQLDKFEPLNIDLPRTEDAPKLPFFVVYAKIVPEEILLDPSLNITLDMFNQIMSLWQEKTIIIKSFVGDPYYSVFTTPIINEKVEDRICGWGPTLEFYLKKDEYLTKNQEELRNYFKRNYEAAFQYLRRYDPIRQFYAEDILVEKEDIENERDLETFRNLCTRYYREIATIESIKPSQEMGVLFIQLEGFNETCLPVSTQLLGYLERTIPWIGKTKVDEMIEEANEIEAFLAKEPVLTADYVKYLDYIEESNQRIDKMEETLDYCKELYDIIEEFHIDVAIEEINAYYNLSVALGTLRNVVDRKMEDSARLIKLFSDNLNKDISALISQVGNIKDECMQPWLYDINSKFAEVMDFLSELFDKLIDAQKRANEFKEYQKQFRLEVTRFDILDEVMNDVKLRILLWESVDSWAKTVDEWYHAVFDTLNVDDMNAFIAKNMKYIAQLEKGLPPNLIVPKFRDEVELMKDKLPVVCYLRNPAMKNRHWLKVENQLNHKFKPDEVMTLALLENLGVFNYPTELMEISGQASSEAGLEALLKKVEEAWKTLEFPVIQHKDSKDVYIFGSLEEVQAALDESNINMATIVSSKHVGPIKPRVDEWSKNLDLFSRTLDEWMMCQQSWVYLEVIFSAPDIQRQLPNEAKLFTIVDKSWKEIMRRTAKMPLAMESGLYPGTLEAFQRNNALLEQIMKCLESYLETKRVAFPRFYFLSNDELLDILAQTRNPHAVQPHLRKCFDAIAKLEFGVKVPDEIEENADKKKDEPVEVVLTTDIIAMISPEGERVVLGKGLKARGNVEDWLGKVEESMVLSLKRLMKASLVHYHNHPRTEWVLAHANQIILTVSQIMWAKGVHDIFDAPASVNKIKKMEQYETKCIHDLNNLAVLVRQDLPSVTRKILVALITIDVHARDTISNIVSSKITNSMSFEWLKVLRYYWDEVIDDCVARMSSAYYIYGYEYLGAAGVLVITPLTDKCYLCLMGALQLDLGGAPAGPAGTGKTETTKDLAKALAIQCVVFNCSEGLDYKMMGRFFSGLAQSGAWCCFDEFNRIDIEVLSVIAQQLITIRNAKAAKAQRFMFEGREIKLVQKCAAFITMNPGYAGRTELPDNLKALFRPISMMVPDYALIAEVILYSEGFESSKNLSQKMVQMYKLCSEQLSQQDHYDFGMRAVKSVLVMAGSLKRSAPDREENVVLICALRDSNLPKFLSDDAILFTGILGDLFPGVDLPVPDYGVFQNTIIEVMVEHNLQPEHCMIHKVIQLYETMIVRWGVMLVGPTGGGKTEILNTLNRTLTKMHEYGIPGQQFRPVRTYKMNPKAVTAGELYGEVNQFTLEWKDGLMGIMMRTAVGFTTEEHQWIICDGPVDAVWIENLNTVLDDNKMLCLANSERIKLTQWVHMVFEVQDLAQASPATVSRCGMVYVDSEEIKWFPYVKSWINRISENLLTQEMKEYILQLFDYAVEKGFRFVKKHCHYSIHQVDVSKAKMICSLIESYIKMPGAMDKIGEKSKVRCFLCQTFIFAYLWGVGGNLMDESREKFEITIREQFDEHPDSKLQAGHDLWDVYMDVVAHKLELWSRIIPSFQYNPEISYFETLVPTMDTVRFGYIMERLINVDNPVFITGDTGVGKSVVAKDCLQRLFLTKKFVPATMNFSAQTSSFRTQEIIELKLEKKKKTLLGAPVGKKVVIFVDDVNMPKLETYGAQPPVELLRQFLDFGGLYDREKLFWKEIRDVIITVACAPPGGGRNPLTPRFVRHFGMLLIPPPSEGALKLIFKSILKGFFTPFTNEVRALAEYMVNAAVDIYQRIESDLLPTPAKSHYVFNLRDLSKCIQGVTQADPGSMRTEVATLRLFYHECLRVFHDRLINIEDKSYFYLLMRDICNRNFGSPVLDLPEGNVIENPPVLLFGDFMQMGAEKANRVYEELRNIDKVKNVLQDYLDDFNLSTAKEMKLIFFMMAIEHCLRIARVLRSERGNALLVGVGGMGKQSLTKLASHLNAYKCFQIELTRNYDHAAFFDDLRKMCFHAGVEFQDSVFLFTDTQIVQEEFLEDINNLLNSGEVPNLYEADEYEKVIIGVRPAAKEAGIDEANRDGIYNYFISRLRDKLHLVICMSPVGDAFRRRCRMFPSLVNCCTIDWFEKWPQEALLSVAENEMRSLGEDLCLHLANVCVYMHESVENMTVRFYNEMKRYYYTTPSSYLELIKLYKSMLGIKKDKIGKTRDKIANGLKKLYETNEVIDSMKETLTALEPVLAQKSVAVEELMVYLGKEQTQADKVRVVVKADEEVAKVKAEETQAIADDAQKDLDTALPALEAATKALESLNKNDINEVKVFQKPPKLVQVVMESVCILLGAKPDWASAKVVLGDANFLKKLQEYDKDHVSDLTMKKLKAYVDNPDFIPEKVQKVSKACKSLCLWVRAIDMYAKVYRIVEPKRKKLQQAEKELGQVMGLLRDKQMKLAEVEGQIADLESKFNETVAEKQALEDNMELTATRLNRAGRLNVALGDEQVRWEESVEKFGIELDNAVGDVVMAAACVAYLGAFTSNYRIELVLSWEKKCQAETIPASETFSLITVLADPYDIRMWNSCGLPRDSVSTENAILVTQAGRWPLMIDPQEQANRWIRQMEADKNLKVIKLTDSNFMRILESAVTIGLPVLLEEVGETLDPTLGPILLKQTFIQGGRTLIRLGESDVEYSDNFRFYITTKLANPHYLPEICIQVTIVNFTVTLSGLEDQLLADVVRLERPDLEHQRTELIIRINSDKAQLKSIEDKILYLLYHSEGNILDDEELIETLNESKETSAIIEARLIETEATEEKISVAREKYRIVAIRGSVLYFVVADLADIDPMYQYSLKYFNQVFNNVIEVSEKNEILEQRLAILLREITKAVYTIISRGLFERHKLVYSFMLCVAVLQQNGIVSDAQWNFLLRGPVGTKTTLPKKPDYPIITDTIWTAANYLSYTYKHFEGLQNELLKIITVQIGDYRLDIQLISNSKPSQINWNDRLDDFDKLMLIKSLAEEKLIFAITEYVKTKLGKVFIESPQVSLPVLYQDTSNSVPLIFILSTGSDPFGAFQRFAAEMEYGNRIKSISLGQGQGPVAERLIQDAVETGDWVFLQNCHLATSWMLSMEKIVLTIARDSNKVHKQFRLYMSSMPSKTFPVSVLQNSVKVTNEPPKGLRANIKRSFSEMDKAFFEDHPLEHKWKAMLFGLCTFHAVVQERKKFGPLGWNIIYEFNDSDRDFAFNTLKMFCAEGFIPWDALEYLTGEITYGGRVTDYWDLRCLKTILKIFFSPQILRNDYVYSSSGTYYCPVYKNIEDYRIFVDKLPIIEEPEIFGMHENANIAYQIKETNAVIRTIVDCQPRASGSAEGRSSDDIVYELAEGILNSVIPKIPTDDVNVHMYKRDKKGRISSLTTVLTQEIDRYDKLLRLIHSSMKQLQKAIKGLVVMSDALEEIFTAFMNNQVPGMWSKNAYNSLKSLGSWIRDLILRLDFISIWVRYGPPTSYWISGFYFPQGFLTGTLQTFARKYNLPIDELKYDFHLYNNVLDQEDIYGVHVAQEKEVYTAYKLYEHPIDGVIIHGLFIDAGRWDFKTEELVDAKPGEINPPLPLMWLKPTRKMPPDDPRYVAPLYKTSIRAGVLSTTGHSTNFVIAVLLPTKQNQAYWILKGTALLTQITD
ncbi:dynein axonemal heavy chain 6 isoform X1 [Diorhabda carinulata]|uniref:dynein axonemal heavy chain 6 isoform X1 n=1 Tax=Diorhabda carinulata TaxID=1163345 RepID=UPI0025A1F7E3|nr:dynein axonemal heavy chain 6 isoform X1 [Diorhabda carinulata]